MAVSFVSFKLNNADFPSLPYPSILHYLSLLSSISVSSVSASLAITAYKPFPRNLNIQSSISLAIATGIPISNVPHILQGNFFRNSHRRRSTEKAALECFAIFIGKHLRWNLFLIKLQACR